MREPDAGEPSWFAQWEHQLPSPDELMPLSQSLITPDLALAFDIPTAGNPALAGGDADRTASAAGSNGEEPARTLKRPRLVWTPQLHKRFVDAVAHLGIKNAVPKTIMQLMSVDGLTRENVASHLQKYRLYLKRMQGLGGAAAAANGNPSSSSISAADADTERLFASAPVPHHFLNAGGAPFVHHPQYFPRPPPQQQFGAVFDAGFFSRGAAGVPAGVQRGGAGMGMGIGIGMVSPPSFADELDIGGRDAGRRELTLFPTSGDR